MDSDMLNLEFPDLDASAPTQAGGDRPIKKYANKTFCWKKMFPDATETWAEVSKNAEDERVKQCDEEFSKHDKEYRQLKKEWDAAHPKEKAQVEESLGNIKTKKGGNYGKRSKKRARAADEDEDETGIEPRLREYVRGQVYAAYAEDKNAYLKRKKLYRTVLEALDSKTVPVDVPEVDADVTQPLADE